MLTNTMLYCKIKVDNWFQRVFKEQAGGAELIATLVIIGIVLVLALAFKDKLTGMVASLWNNIVAGQDVNASQDTLVGGTW